MKPLDLKGYRVHETFAISELTGFVVKQVIKLSPWSLAYLGSIALLAAGMGYWAGVSRTGLGQVLDSFSLAALALVPLILVHEGIHALVYKWVGAPQVRFGASLKSMAVYAYAEGFVVNWRPFVWVAVMPFLVINTLLLASMALLPPAGIWVVLIVLMLHALACVGDFGLVNYLYLNRKTDLYTVDDIANQTVYFLEKETAV